MWTISKTEPTDKSKLWFKNGLNDTSVDLEDYIEKAIAPYKNTIYLQPYNKAIIDEISLKGVKSVNNDADPFNDGSGVSVYTFEDGTGGETLVKAEYSTTTSKFGAKSVRFNEAGAEGVTLKESDKQALKNDFTISLWFNVDSTFTGNNHSFHRILSLQRGLSIQVTTYNSIGWSFGNNSAWSIDNTGTFKTFSDAGIQFNTWHNLAVRRSGSNTEILIDGRVVYTQTGWNQDLSGNTRSFQLGDSFNDGGANQPFKGYMDQVRIFKRALTNEELKQIRTETVVETGSSSSSRLLVQGVAYLSNGKISGKYDNKIVILSTSLEPSGTLTNGDYYIKVSENGTLSLVKERPAIGYKVNNAEYYIDGVWYDKTGSKLARQTYLPNTVTVDNNKFTKVNQNNLYPSDMVLGVGQKWIDMSSERHKGYFGPNAGNVFTNTTGRPIKVAVSFDGGGATDQANLCLEIDGKLVAECQCYNGSYPNIVTISEVIPNGSEYKVYTRLGGNIRTWLELR